MSTNSTMVTRINSFQAVEGKEDELHDFLRSLIPYIQESEGCVSVDVLRSTSETNAFVVIEKWQSQEDHQRSVANFPQEEMLAAMPLFGASPKGDYYTG